MAKQHATRRGIRDNFSGTGEARRGEAGRGTVWFGLDGRGNNAFRCAVTPGNFQQMETQDMINEEEVRRLPLWKDWIERNEHRLAYGLTVTTEEMEAALEEKSHTMAFGMAYHNIRVVLRQRGMNFSQRGLRGAGFQILPPNTNADEMEHLNRVAVNSLTASVILGTRTNLNLLSECERKRHEAVTEKMAHRVALLSRTNAGLGQEIAKQITQ
jgi:hypothetical protein